MTSSKSTSVIATVGIVRMIGMKAGGPGGTKPTKGRVYDHVGYEVKNLEAFCKALEAKGIKLTEPYRVDPATRIATAMTVDPWGVSVELTEGLRAIQ